MPPKRAAEALKSTEECTLQYGKHNNIIKWREHMQTVVTELYGIVGMFFTTNVRYELPRVSYRDYPADSSSESSSSEEEEAAAEGQAALVVDPEAAAYAAARPARVTARLARNERRRKASERSRAKFKEEDYFQRKRVLKSQKENERTMYPDVEAYVATTTEQGQRRTGLSDCVSYSGLRSTVNTHQKNSPHTHVWR